MAIQIQQYVADGTTRTFPQTKYISNKSLCRVFGKSIASGLYEIINSNLYDVINNAIVFDEPISISLYSSFEIRVGDNEDELGDSLSDIAILASIADDIINVSSISADVLIVSDISDKVVTVANNDTNVTTVASNIAGVQDVHNNLAEILVVANMQAELLSIFADKITLDSIYADKLTLDSIFADKAILDSLFNDKLTLDSLYTDKTKLDSLYADKVKLDAVYDGLLDINNFADTYYGTLTVAPTIGSHTTLTQGDLYYDSVLDELRVYGDSGWKSAGSTINGTSKRQSFIATSSQTIFTVTGGYDAGYADVYLNGAKLLNGTDVTVTNGTDVVLVSGATAGDIIDVVAYGAFVLADHYTKAEQDVIDGLQDTALALKAPLDSPALVNPTINGIAQSGYTGFKNYIINGGFDVSQRNDLSTPKAFTNDYMIDRFHSYAIGTGASATIQQNSYVPEAGSRTVSQSVTSNSAYTVFIIRQALESFAHLAGKVVTASCMIRTNTKIGMRFHFGVGSTTPDFYKVAPLQNNTWQKLEFTVTVPTDLECFFLDITSISDGAEDNHIDVVIGDYFEVGSIQLEEGSVATPFEVRPFGLELSLCQRYYEIQDTPTMGLSNYNSWANESQGRIPWKVAKRVPPTVSGYTVHNGNLIASGFGVYSAYFAMNWTSGNSASISGYLLADAEIY